MAFRITSAAFEEGAAIPKKYTCDDVNISPPLQWSGAPEESKSFVLIVDDPDAPSKTWLHWVVYNIPPTTKESLEGGVPAGGIQGLNDFRKAQYNGPCPPGGKHRYFFKIYALDSLLDLPEKASLSQVEKAMEGHVITYTHLIGTYQR